jgi:PKD repeat protein
VQQPGLRRLRAAGDRKAETKKFLTEKVPMKLKNEMKPPAGRRWAGRAGLLAAIAAGALLGSTGQAAEDIYRMPGPLDGGVPAQSTITSSAITPTNASLCWYGMRGWYSVETSTNGGSSWSSVGRTEAGNFATCITVTNLGGPSALFRLNQNNAFAGAGACAGCHGDKYSRYLTTEHSTAFSLIASMPQSVQTNCLVCHTVGYQQPSGFVDTTTTPQLMNVQCENCHGPAAWHKYSDHDIVRPAVSIDPAICGGCHQDSHHPTFEEYSESPHSQVNDDNKYGFSGGVYYTNTYFTGTNTWYGYYVTTNSNGTLKTNATTGIVNSLWGPGNNQLYDAGQDKASTCGTCHSGATRLMMVKDWQDRQNGITNALDMPSGKDAGAWGPTCAVCHDPHEKYNTAQLRWPTRSTNFYTIASSNDKRTVYTTNFMGAVTTNVQFWNTPFATLYDPNVQVCGQCHNTRGARWDGRAYGYITNGTTVTFGVTTNLTGYSRPPHHSPQYNILIGIVQPDYLTTNSLGVATNFTAHHSGVSGTPFNTNQCATCHMPSYAVSANTNVTGHTFELNRLGCNLGGCHLSGVPDIESTQINTTNNLTRLVDLLNQWATNYAPALLGSTAYNTSKQNSWEFTTPGGLAGITNAGPSTANQLKLPEAIRQARFNAYMVLHDGSMGVHNPKFIPFLLQDAERKILSQFTGASFTANTPNVWVNTAVWFTNLNAAATAATWDFGDGSGTVSGLGPISHSYAAAGTYTVTLTTTDPAGTTTLTRNGYIIAYAKPIPSFTMSASTGPAPLTVNFTNTSANAIYYRWTYMNNVSTTFYSNEENPPAFTYTNAGTYQVKLTAYNPGGNIAITNSVTVTP